MIELTYTFINAIRLKMGKHSFRQLKIKGTRGPYNKSNDLTDKQKREHKIKHMQVYLRRIEQVAELFMPNLIEKFYKYLIKSNYKGIANFIKIQLKTQIAILIKAYRNEYSVEEYINTENLIKKKITELVNADQAFSAFGIPRTTSETIIKDILDNFKKL